jgi:DNA-binding NarL/FixJ family response regulator
MLLDIVAGVIRALDDMEVVDCSETLTDPAETAARTAADLVILGCEEEELLQIGGRLLHVNPDIKVLAVEADGRRAFLYQLRPHKVTLGEVSPGTLVKAIRQAFAAPNEPEGLESKGGSRPNPSGWRP